MAIGYARVEFVKRSSGKTSCAKSAYNSRSRIEFEGNCVLSPETFDWRDKEPPEHHEILLPQGAAETLKSPQVLWNKVEQKEMKINSQVAIELLLALPDDKVITLEDRIALTRTFVKANFIDKGLIAQIDIHSPEKRIRISRDNRELGLYKEMLGNVISTKDNLLIVQFDSKRTISFDPNEFTGFIETENNWHAHVLITTRRLDKTGLDFEDSKARDLMPRICKGKVVSGDDWGKLWTDHQNKYFEEKGLSLRVDPSGIESQVHLGPVRMRGRAFDLLDEHAQIAESNIQNAHDPVEVLKKISERQSVFSKEDVDRFIQKHLPSEGHTTFNEVFWKQKDLIPLINKETGEITDKFSSQKVIDEEISILRLADKLRSQKSLVIDLKKSTQHSQSLSLEQKNAYSVILQGNKLTCLQGYAGTGKSHLLAAIQKTYTEAGYTVRAFGPDNATADVLKEKGFQKAENIYRFLYCFYNSKRNSTKNKEIWILDEAGKLGNRPLLEFLKAAYKQQAQVIFSGDNAQLTSVERGGMFKTFCERYASATLQNIQRQKQEYQREISTHLATGETGPAIDKLSSASTIQWAQTKKDAMEALILKWAQDTRANPTASTLILAHSNDEVRVLNEMVRIIKKQRGELSEKEFACETFVGKVYLSIGDQIEFRKNDKILAVTNGLSGTLLEATPTKFVVSINNNKSQPRTITFNPQEYNAYQPAYASTHYRSQGKTVDMAYVLHSPALNKKLFYVGLTRHSNEAYYFVSKTQAYCLADLKRQAARDNTKENTLSFTTPKNLDSHLQDLQKRQEIQELKESDSFTKKLKGYGLAAFDFLKTTTHNLREHMQDKTLSKEFFTHSSPINPLKSEVNEVVPVDDELVESQESNVGHPASPPSFDDRLEKASDLTQQSAIQDYLALSSQASTLRSIVDMEMDSSEQEIRASPHYKEWIVTCGKRNALAHTLTRIFPRDELGELVGKNAIKPLLDQSLRYQKFIDQSPKNRSIEAELQNHIEPFLYRIFPEGPYKKTNKEFRFGNKGSLSVTCIGERIGQFYDFEKQEGGGLLQLAQRQLGLGRLEALEWAKDFLGIVHDIKVPKVFLRASSTPSKDSDWVSLSPDPKIPAPPLDQIGTKKLQHFYDETTRHAYKDENGNLLYYRLRLTSKTDPSKKSTPPLSYGYWKSNPNTFLWELKGCDLAKTHLYNLPALKQNPTSIVLIVEGEKTADKAALNLPNESLVCITWPGGAGAARKADWSPLIGRNVIIWPDNDQSGIQAATDICTELKKVGIQSLRIIDPSILQKHFPPKWDLADPLPKGLDPKILETFFSTALEKGIDPSKVIHRISSQYNSNDPIDRARVNELLWRVDERLRPTLEKKMEGQHWKINETIAEETARLLLRYKEETDLRLSWQKTIYEAHYGQSPSTEVLSQMKEAIKPHSKQTDKISELALDKVLTASPGKATPNMIKEEVHLLGKLIERVQLMGTVAYIEKDLCKELNIAGK